MTEQEHQTVTEWINSYKLENRHYPTHMEILTKMLQVAKEVTYKDGIEYGLGSTFRSRISDLRKNMNISSYDLPAPTRYGSTARVKAHKLA